MKNKLIVLFLIFAFPIFYTHAVTLDELIEQSAQKITAQIDGNVKTVTILSIRCQYSSLNDYIVESMNYYLSSMLKKTSLVERDDYARKLIQKEFDFQTSGYVSDETAASICSALGADTLILGSMESISSGWQLSLRVTHMESQKVLLSWRGRLGPNDPEVRFQIAKSQGNSTSLPPQAAQPQKSASPAPKQASPVKNTSFSNTGSTRYEFDPSSIPGSFRDFIVLINKTRSGECNVSVSAEAGNGWVEIGNAGLNRYGSENKFKAPSPYKISSFRTFALNSSIPYSYKITKQNNDLIIEVLEAGSKEATDFKPDWTGASNAWVFDLKAFRDEPDEEVKIICQNVTAITSYSLYTFIENKQQWIEYGNTEVERKDRTYKIKKNSGIKDLDDYRFYALVPKKGGTFRYSLKKDDDDLIITIN
ncbi:hypothetical protein [Treponema sp.]|uniref:hypothetical protein n=1 Tax=Treponema sp. TaxID=166 RepID=UPI00388DCB0B